MFKAGEIFKSFKKGFVFGLGALAALVTTSLLAAGAMHVFLSGETLDAAEPPPKRGQKTWPSFTACARIADFSFVNFVPLRDGGGIQRACSPSVV